MPEAIGSTASSAIPQETNALLQQIVFELRALQMLLALGMNIPDSIERIRAEVKSGVDTVITP